MAALNFKGRMNAQKLIADSSVDKTSSWSFSAADGNKILGDPPDWTEYAKWFLGVDNDFDPETKEHYKYPFGKNGKVYRSGLIAIRQRAAQQDETDIYDAAGMLIDRIDNGQNNMKKNHYSRSPFNRDRRNIAPIINKSSKSSGVDEATMYIYDEISWFGIDAGDFVKKLNAQTSKNINVRINSPGGSVFDGVSIYNAMKQHPSNIIVHVDGLAGSIASVIAMGGNELRMAKSGYLMIHNPFSLVIGTAEDMRQEADLLDKVGGTLAEIYADKSGKDINQFHAMMDAETWIKGQEAVDMGLADSVYSESKQVDNPANLFDLSIFANVPNELIKTDGEPTERELERILRDAGCSAKRAKAILSKGYGEQRDVEPPPAEPQRDVEPKDRVAALLKRAEMIAPSHQ